MGASFKAKGFQFSNSVMCTLTAAKLLNAADTAIAASVWNLIGKVQMSAGLAYELGYGSDNGQDSAPSRIYGLLKDTAAAELVGTIKFVILDEEQNQVEGGHIAEFGYSDLKTDAADRTKKLPLPATGKIATQDKYIGIFYYGAIGNGTLDVSASVLDANFTKWKASRI